MSDHMYRMSTFHVRHIHIANVFHQEVQHIHMPIERLYGTYRIAYRQQLQYTVH